ncbi:MAG: aminoacyl-tRNA hydrolase [Cyclobacteriaceae bacterium]|nr:aminoacyl-tRNA hydrolase [Cyclobacteriaceae bacterium]
MIQAPALAEILHEFVFTTSRSSGPGGQNVNKVNTKVTLRWDVLQSTSITDEQRTLVREKLKSYFTKEGVLILTAQEKRSQLANKETVLRKLDLLLKKAFFRKKVRKATKPSKASTTKRLESKKQQAEKKQWRKKL